MTPKVAKKSTRSFFEGNVLADFQKVFAETAAPHRNLSKMEAPFPLMDTTGCTTGCETTGCTTGCETTGCTTGC